MPGLGRLPSCQELADGLPDGGIASAPPTHPWYYRPNRDTARSPSVFSAASTAPSSVTAQFLDESSAAFARFAQSVRSTGAKPEFDAMYTLSELRKASFAVIAYVYRARDTIREGKVGSVLDVDNALHDERMASHSENLYYAAVVDRAQWTAPPKPNDVDSMMLADCLDDAEDHHHDNNNNSINSVKLTPAPAH